MTYRRAMPKRRPGYVYEFWGYDPRALLRGYIKIVLIYVGQTRQKPETRWHQHQYGSPNGEPPKVWWPLVTQRKVAHSALFITSPKLDRKEAWRIVRGQPLANIKLNRFNTKRIPPYEMKRLMAQIERAGGVKVLVANAHGRDRTVAGWTITPGGVTWYGSQAGRVGAAWLKQSTGSLSPSGSLSGPRSASTVRRSEFGSTELAPACASPGPQSSWREWLRGA